MDSGSAVSVAPPNVAPWVQMTESEGSRTGVEYTAADGGNIPNLGQQVLEVTQGEGWTRCICGRMVIHGGACDHMT